MITLATGLAIHDGRVLLVASRYPNHPEPLWNLPGGRQMPGELLGETVVREFVEETGLDVRVEELAYVSESYDGAEHFVNATFKVDPITCFDTLRFDKLSVAGQHGKGIDDHVVAVELVPIDEIERRIIVGVVREPLLAYLRGELPQRYTGFHEAGITIEWPDDSQ
jgi:8-oxo-dGTP pyrophosphatase MutT (NUDIX family)